MKKMVYVILVAATALIGCGKKGGNSNANPYGQCGNQYGVNNQYGNTQYQLRNGTCVDTRSNRPVSVQYCQNNQMNNNGYNPGFDSGYNNGYQQNCAGGYYGGNGGGGYYGGTGGQYNQYNQVGVTSVQCQSVANQYGYNGNYYVYQYFPGTGTYLCVEYTTGQQSYPYGQPAFNYGTGYGANVGFYGYIHF